MSRTPIPLTLRSLSLLAVLMFLARPGPVRADDAKATDKDLAAIQGKWVREAAGNDAGYQRATKEVKGNRETVTFYDRNGKVVHKHNVAFKVSKHGDVNVFTYSNMEITEGPQKGSTIPESHSYVYRVADGEFREVTGLLAGDEGDASLTVWKKAAAEGADAAAATAAATEKAGAIDAKALEGTWEPTMNERGGNVEPEEQTKRHRLIFKGDKFTITRDGETMLAGTYKLNAGAKPAQIDMTIDEAPQNEDDKGKVVLGIIELTGDGMKWCTGGPRSTERPKEFKSEEGSRDMVVVLKREKKE